MPRKKERAREHPARREADPLPLEPDLERDARSPWVRVLPVLLALAGFSIYLTVCLRLDALRGFADFNMFFGADPNKILEAFAEGASARHTAAHPHLGGLVSPVIRTLSAVVTFLSGARLGGPELRRALALMVAPAAGAIESYVLFRLLAGLRVRLSVAFFLVLLSVVSFSQLMFSSIPESFVLNGLALALGYVLLLDAPGRGARLNHGIWLCLGLLATGVTITNVVPLAFLYGKSEALRGAPRGRAVGRAFLFAALVLLVTVVSMWIVDAVRGVGVEAYYTVRHVAMYLVPPSQGHALVFPSAVVNGIAPAQGIWMKSNLTCLGDVFPYTFTVQRTRWASVRNLLGLALVAGLAWAALRRRATNARLADLCPVSLGILAYNWILHSFWGPEQFLYSQHWHVPLLLLILCMLSTFPRLTRWRALILAASASVCAIVNAAMLRRMIAIIASWEASLPSR